MVAEVAESNQRNAAGNGGVFSLLAGVAIGCALAGLLEFTRTFGAFGNLQFIPTEATEASFVSWTWAMISAPVAVVASSLIVALSLARFRSIFIAASLSLIATLWLAARVLENVNGYLIVSDNGPAADAPPLAADRWPFVYRHGVAVLVCGVVIALAALAYALWRTRPRAIAFTFGLLAALLIVYLGGQFGFAAMSFLRLRNLTGAVAVIDLVIVALSFRQRRDLLLLLAFVILAASAWQLDRSWRSILAELPRGIETPAW
ncbi:MAG TPA: hypothetical protein VGQ21_03080 [Thermoanaerobaculia bacterium]|nr:hypothetical protein [Thermoanaerobaculia bacterium]